MLHVADLSPPSHAQLSNRRHIYYQLLLICTLTQLCPDRSASAFIPIVHVKYCALVRISAAVGLIIVDCDRMAAIENVVA